MVISATGGFSSAYNTVGTCNSWEEIEGCSGRIIPQGSAKTREIKDAPSNPMMKTTHYELPGVHRDEGVQVEIWVSREAYTFGQLESYTFSPNMCCIL